MDVVTAGLWDKYPQWMLTESQEEASLGHKKVGHGWGMLCRLHNNNKNNSPALGECSFSYACASKGILVFLLLTQECGCNISEDGGFPIHLIPDLPGREVASGKKAFLVPFTC